MADSSKSESTKKEPGRRRASASRRKARLVKQLLKSMEKKLKAEEPKATIGDFIRLVQLDKELDEETPREIEVTWVEPEASDDSGA